MKLVREFFFFGLAGTVGFLVDAAVLYALKSELGLFVARGVSFLSAVLATWLINRSVTFVHRRTEMSVHREFLMYVAVMIVGGMVNYASYAWLILEYRFVSDHPIVGVAIGSLAGMFLNLLNSRFLIYRNRR